ncbi:MAG: GGDEF domain-containing protein [Rhizobiales bacterium]|nr:GGDEF domain-containing protein [Hyphomicrobiales bacterium]
MFFGRFQSRSASISDAIYLQIIGTLYGTTVPILVAGICQAIVGAISVRESGDTLTAVLTVLGVVVAIARMIDVSAFRRQTRRTPLSDRAEAMRWERRYAVGTVVTAFILGLFAARSLFVADAICLVMAIGIGFGFCAGIVARLSLLPALAILDFIVIGLPVIAAALIKQWDVAHVALALMFLVFIVVGVEMVRLSYAAMMNQMTLKQTFEKLARIDPMTGLLNRSVLTTDFARLVAQSGSATVAVHAIDLDHFKAANDRYGHPVGDALLKQVASRLKSLSSPADLIVRMGGDEFILVQVSAASRSDAESTAQRIFEAIGAPYHVDGHEIRIGASIGIAVSPEHGRTVEALLSRSDAALYRAKERRGGYVFASEAAATEECRPRAA